MIPLRILPYLGFCVGIAIVYWLASKGNLSFSSIPFIILLVMFFVFRRSIQWGHLVAPLVLSGVLAVASEVSQRLQFRAHQLAAKSGVYIDGAYDSAKLEEATKFFRSAYFTYPLNLEAGRQLAWSKFFKGGYGESRAFFHLLLLLFPMDEEAKFGLLLSEYVMGEDARKSELVEFANREPHELRFDPKWFLTRSFGNRPSLMAPE